MNVTMLTHTQQPELVCSTAARLCYSNSDIQDIITAGPNVGLLEKILDSGHHSVLEHASFTFGIDGISRVTSHQLVRHRIASFCLSGDTIVVAFSHKKSRSPKRWTIERLHEMTLHHHGRSRLKLIRLRSKDENGILVPNSIKSVMYSGEQDVYEVTVQSGRKIKSTLEHRFCTNNGYIPLKSLSVGDKVICNGLPAHKNKEWIEDFYINKNMSRKEVADLAGVSDPCLGQWIRRFGIFKPKSDYPNRKGGRGHKGMFSTEAKQKLSDQKKGEKNPGWVGERALPNTGRQRARNLYPVSTCGACGSSERIELHHVDKNPLNNSPDNIKQLCPSCHKAFHIGQAVLSVFTDEIVEIKYIGKEKTYDIEMNEPHHNFVANGFVVHNSQQSQRYVALGDNTSFVIPPTAQNNPKALEIFSHHLASIHDQYAQLTAMGIPPEDARYLLPNATETSLIMTMNARELLHFFELRCCNRAQWEIRGVANEMLALCKQVAPNIFKLAGPSCVAGTCNEGQMSCKNQKENK